MPQFAYRFSWASTCPPADVLTTTSPHTSPSPSQRPFFQPGGRARWAYNNGWLERNAQGTSCQNSKSSSPMKDLPVPAPRTSCTLALEAKSLTQFPMLCGVTGCLPMDPQTKLCRRATEEIVALRQKPMQSYNNTARLCKGRVREGCVGRAQDHFWGSQDAWQTLPNSEPHDVINARVPVRRKKTSKA